MHYPQRRRRPIELPPEWRLLAERLAAEVEAENLERIRKVAAATGGHTESAQPIHSSLADAENSQERSSS